jgi:uncharacterized caspase-like protein
MKAVNDADAVASELSKLGFEVVKAEDVGRRAMSRALVKLEGKIGPGDTALIYFAGHGFAIDGTTICSPWMCQLRARERRAWCATPPSPRTASLTACRRRAPRR